VKGSESESVSEWKRRKKGWNEMEETWEWKKDKSLTFFLRVTSLC